VKDLGGALLCFATTAWPLSQLGGEFMPAMDEGDLLYMPSALPGLSAAKAAELLQQTDRLIRTVPEVATVFGKAGRAETATDPAPLEMFETTIQFKPRDQWRPGMTPDEAGRRAGPDGQRPRPDQRLGASHPQPHRHAGDGHQEPDRRQGVGR
jgi:copper/silver efflux system protein